MSTKYIVGWILILGVLVVYQILDIWQTYLLLQFDAYEFNPLVSYFIDIFGNPEGMIIFKSIFVVMIVLFGTLEIFYEAKRGRKNG